MRNQLKKGISLLLTLCMVAAMLMPMAALAEDSDAPSGEVQGVSDALPMADVIPPPADEAIPSPAPEGEDTTAEDLSVQTEAVQRAAVPVGPCTVQSGDDAVIYTHADGTTTKPVNTSGKDVNGTWYGYENLRYVLIGHKDPDPEVYPSVTLTFQGTGITVYGQGAANGPLMSVMIDDNAEGEADFNGTGPVIKVYEKLGLTDGEHTITLTFTRETNSTTSHTKTGLQAAVDRFEIAGPAEAQTVTVENGTADPAAALPGAAVTVTADPAPEGMEFRGWTSPDGVVFDDPTAATATFTMPAAPVTVKAEYKPIGSEEISPEVMTATAPSEELTKSDISTEGPASLVLDGNPNTFWCTDWTEHPTAENRYIMLDLGGLYRVDGLSYVERPKSNGCIKDYDILVSTDGKTFTSVATGAWVPGNKSVQQVDFAPVLATHVKLLAVHTEGNPPDAFATAAELRVTGVAIAHITQAKGADGSVKLNFNASQLPDADYKYYYSAEKTATKAPALGEARDAEVYGTELTDGAELPRVKREYVNVVLVDGDDKVITFQSIEITHGEPREYQVTVIGDGCTVSGGGQDEDWLPEGGTVRITAPEKGEATMVFHHWSSEDGVVFADPTSAATTFTMPAKAVAVKANYAYPAGSTFYLDSENGSDENSGLAMDAPWKTLGKMNNVLLQPGDRVLLKAGSVFEGQSLSLRGSGSEDAPILVDMYAGETVGIEAGEKPVIHANGLSKADFSVGKEGDTGTTARPDVAYGVHIKNVSHIQVNNLEITNTSGTRQMAVGVVVEATSGNGVTRGIHLNGLYVHDVFGTLTEKTAPNGGIYIITTPANGDVAHPTRYDDISIQNCTVKDVSRTGISVGSSHSAYYWERHPGGIIPEEVKSKYGHTKVVIRNNYVERAGGDAIVPQFCISPLIEYNVSSAASLNTKDNHGAMYNAAIWPWRCEDAVFQYNEAYGTYNNGDGQAYDCDFSRGTIYQYNYSHDNEGGFILLCKEQSVQSTVRYNVSQNDLDSLFLVSNTTPAEIYNNTFYIGEGLSTIVEGNGPANLKNNIFYNAGTKKTYGWGKFQYDNNLYYGFDATPDDAHKIVDDPLFENPGQGGSGVEGNSAIDTLGGYALKAGSPAIGAGVVIPDNGGRDYAGNLVSDVQKPSLGAMEYATDYHTVTVEGGTADKKITSAGDIITITATPPAGQMLDQWIGEGVEFANKNDVTTTFTMPDSDVTVTATFRDIPGTPSNTTTKTEKNEDGSVTTTKTDKRTGTVTETTKYPDGKKVEIITEKSGAVAKTVTEADGKEIKSVITAAGDKTVSVTDKDGGKVAEISIPAEIPAPEKPFDDVAEHSWAKSAVDLVTGLGLFTGTGGNRFSGELPMSRGMLTTVLHRLSGEIPGGEHAFDDVAEDAWYASSAAWAVKAGIVTGTGGGKFAPEENLTRESLAVMLFRYADLLGMDTKAPGDGLLEYADGESVSTWAADAINWAVAEGIITGKSGGKLDPSGHATRAEVAAMLQRFIKSSLM